jgi:thiol-disulfide isomerase/thioredoxin
MQPEPGIAGQVAPEWNVPIWFNLPEGHTVLHLADLKGRAVYLYGFQSWCPGCHSHGFPTLVGTMKELGDDPNVAFVAVQTVFEGFEANTAQAAQDTAIKFGLTIPLGHDVGPNNGPSALTRNYRTGGTPWVVLIDPNGIVRFNGFSIEVPAAVATLRTLVTETSS